jgi:hypothetical protein
MQGCSLHTKRMEYTSQTWAQRNLLFISKHYQRRMGIKKKKKK